MAVIHNTFPQLTPQELDRFYSRVDKQGDDKCWPWTGTIGRQKYGFIKLRRVMMRPHRLAYLLAYGKDPDQMMVCHRCDNPPCCNPAHLFLGTNRDNQIDARNKGRLNPAKGDRHFSKIHPERVARGERHSTKTKPESFLLCRGETHYAAKLTEQGVRDIRETYAEGYDTMQEIADRYGLNSTTVHGIIHRTRWKHVE